MSPITRERNKKTREKMIDTRFAGGLASFIFHSKQDSHAPSREAVGHFFDGFVLQESTWMCLCVVMF